MLIKLVDFNNSGFSTNVIIALITRPVAIVATLFQKLEDCLDLLNFFNIYFITFESKSDILDTAICMCR